MNNKNGELTNFLNKHFLGYYKTNELLSDHTWYKIGGPADFVAWPKNIEDLVNLLLKCRDLNIETFFLGDGANLLVSDDGYRGVIICLKRFFRNISISDNVISVDSGVLLETMVEHCENAGLSGVHCLSGVPGTIGGALIMNAGTASGEIGESVKEVSILDSELIFQTLTAGMIDFNYRSVPQLQDKIILGCKLELKPEKTSFLKKFRINQIKNRCLKQPLEYPSCGSVFKRPSNHFVGKLVEEAGLKGFRYGGAMISDKHCGFIVNIGNASAKDILYLIEKVQTVIFEKFNVVLEPEVRYLSA